MSEKGWGKWSEVHELELLRMKGRGLSNGDLAAHFGRSAQAIKAKLSELRLSPEKVAQRLEYDRERRRTNGECINARRRELRAEARREVFFPVVPIVPDPEAIEQMWARRELWPRDLTAHLMGDPLPGYSALDKR